MVHVQDFWVSFKGVQAFSVVPGNSATVEVAAGSNNGLDAPIEPSCPSDLGPGITCTLAKTTVNPGESTLLTLTTTAWTLPSVRPVPVTATATVAGKQVIRTANINAYIGSFSFPVDTPTLTVPNGGEAVFYVVADSSTYASNPADVSCASTYPGVTCETSLHTNLPSYMVAEAHTTAGITPVGAHQVILTVTVAGETYEIPLTVVMHRPGT